MLIINDGDLEKYNNFFYGYRYLNNNGFFITLKYINGKLLIGGSKIMPIIYIYKNLALSTNEEELVYWLKKIKNIELVKKPEIHHNEIRHECDWSTTMCNYEGLIATRLDEYIEINKNIINIKKRKVNFHKYELTEDIIKYIIDKYKNIKNVAIDITGGLDSRILFCLHKQNAKLFYFKEQNVTDGDKEIVNKLRNAFNIKTVDKIKNCTRISGYGAELFKEANEYTKFIGCIEHFRYRYISSFLRAFIKEKIFTVVPFLDNELIECYTDRPWIIQSYFKDNYKDYSVVNEYYDTHDKTIKSMDNLKPFYEKVNNMKIYAVDFDNCLVFSDKDLNIIKKNDDVFNYFLNIDRKENKIILWTCRTGKQLEDAVKFCKKNGLIFDKVNDNLEEIKKQGCYSRKIFADYYVDDKSVELYNFRETNNND